MIKVNFIANELAERKNARIRKYVFLIYSVSWVIALFTIFLQFQNKQSLINIYYDKLNNIKVRIEKLSPQIQLAVSLYQEKNQHKKN